MKIKFYQVLAFFIVTLFLDLEYNASGVKIRPIDIYLAIVFVLMFLSHKPVKINLHFVTMTFYVFIIYMVINSFSKVPFSTLIKETVQICEYLFLMHLIAGVTSDPAKRNAFLNIIFWGTGIVALFDAGYHISRGIYSGFKDLDSPKHSFAYFALFAIINYFNSKKNKGIHLLVVLTALLMSLLSGERKGWAGLFAGAAFFVISQLNSSASTRNVRAITRFFSVVIFIGILTFFVLIGNSSFHYFDKQISTVSNVWERFTSSNTVADTKSDNERIFMFNYGIALFYKHPVFGIGIEQFPVSISKATHGLYKHDAHNFYLKILDEEGVIGLSLLIIFNVALFVFLLGYSRSKVPHIAFTARAVLSLFLLGTVVNCFLASKALTWMYFLIPCGVFLGLNKEIRERKKITAQYTSRPVRSVPDLVLN